MAQQFREAFQRLSKNLGSAAGGGGGGAGLGGNGCGRQQADGGRAQQVELPHEHPLRKPHAILCRHVGV